MASKNLQSVLRMQGASLQYSTDGTTFTAIPGVSGFDPSGGDPNTDSAVTFEGQSQYTGPPQAQTIAVGLNAYNPQHSAMQALAQAYENSTRLSFKFLTAPEEVLFGPTASGNTAAVTTDGAVTFVGDKPDLLSRDYGPGYVLKVGNKKLVFEAISATGALTVDAPSAAVAAGIYSVVLPQLVLGPFQATVGAVQFTAQAESALNATVQLFPISPPDYSTDWQVV